MNVPQCVSHRKYARILFGIYAKNTFNGKINICDSTLL